MKSCYWTSRTTYNCLYHNWKWMLNNRYGCTCWIQYISKANGKDQQQLWHEDWVIPVVIGVLGSILLKFKECVDQLYFLMATVSILRKLISAWGSSDLTLSILPGTEDIYATWWTDRIQRKTCQTAEYLNITNHKMSVKNFKQIWKRCKTMGKM